MAYPTAMNSQITDAIAQADAKGDGENPAAPKSATPAPQRPDAPNQKK